MSQALTDEDVETPRLNDRGVDEDIASDWQAILDKHRETDDDDGQGAQQPGETGGEGGDEPARTPGRAADGRFRGREKPSGDPAVPADDKPGEHRPNEGGAQPEPGRRQFDLTRAPSSWKPAARNEWAKLPETVRQQIYQREEDSHRGAQQLQQTAKFGQELQSVIDPHRQMIDMEGGTPQTAVAELLRTAAVLRFGTPQQKYQTFAAVAHRYGINLAAFQPRQGQPGQQPQPGQNGQYFDPRVDGLLQSLQQREQNQARQVQAETENLALSWMNEADKDGNPVRPWAGDVVDDMTALIPHIQNRNPSWTHPQVMQAAYDQAIWANPEIRAILQAEASAGTQTPGENQQRVNGAKRAASVNTPRRASIPTSGPPGTIDDTLLETARTLGLVS
jgi:hypothetical protein